MSSFWGDLQQEYTINPKITKIALYLKHLKTKISIFITKETVSSLKQSH